MALTTASGVTVDPLVCMSEKIQKLLIVTEVCRKFSALTLHFEGLRSCFGKSKHSVELEHVLNQTPEMRIVEGDSKFAGRNILYFTRFFQQ